MSDDPRCSAPAAIREVTDEAKTRGLEVVFHVAAPPDDLLDLFWDLGNLRRLFPDILDLEVVGQAPGNPPLSLDIAYRVNAVVKEVRYVIRRTLDRDRRAIEWREVSGDLKRVRGGWWFEPTDDPMVSKARYRAFVDIGRFVPTRLVAKGAKRKAGEMVARVRAVVLERFGAPYSRG